MQAKPTERATEMESAEIVAAEVNAISTNRPTSNICLREAQMASQREPSKGEEKGRILVFRPRMSRSWNPKLRLPDQSRSPVSDPSEYSRGPAEDDYGHRMFINLLAFLVLSFIVCCGFWLAGNISERKDQDCGRISRENCTPIPAPADRR
jgi:hypothetical protein